jgi:hypothetical protein
VAIAGPKVGGRNKGLGAVFGHKCNILRTCGNRLWASGFANLDRAGVHPSTHLTHILSVVYFNGMAEEKEKSRSKDILLWVITVALIALAIYWYKR